MKLKLDLDPRIPIIEVRNIQNKHVELSMIGHKPIIVKKGLEFDHYKEYLPTDDARLIDWKASLRSGRLQVRVFQEDKSLAVLFLVDTSASMVYGTVDKLKIEYAFELVSNLSFGILANNDKVGLSLFNDQVMKQVPPNDGMSFYGVIQETLLNYEYFGGMSNMVEPIFRVNEARKDVNIVVIVSDFINIDQEFTKYLAAIPTSMDIVGIMISDPTDLSIPPDLGMVSIKDPFTGELKNINTWASAQDYIKKNKHRLNVIEQAFGQVDGSFLKLLTSEKFDDKVMDFFGERSHGGGLR